MSGVSQKLKMEYYIIYMGGSERKEGRTHSELISWTTSYLERWTGAGASES